MIERVNTGGLKEFRYPRGWKPKRDIETGEKIEEAYGKYYKKRRIKRIIGWVIFLIIIIIVYLLARKYIGKPFFP